MQAAQATLRQSVPAALLVQSVRDASRTGYAEAKREAFAYSDPDADASRTGYAEAKCTGFVDLLDIAGCKPHRLR